MPFVCYLCGMKKNALTTPTFIVDGETTLLKFLFEQLSDRSKTTVKSYLSHRQVIVNGCITTQFDAALRSGDTVEINLGRAKEGLEHPKLKIVYEDDSLIVVEKKEGLLSVATDKQIMRTAYSILSEHVKKEDARNRIFILHRLDRETSGLMMFAKDQEVKHTVQSQWKEVVTERKYFAVVEGLIEKEQGCVSTYLTESKALKVYATNKEEGKIANTYYKVLKRSEKNNVTLLELQLETGRKNQIRAHMEYIGHPIIGDKKYGAKQMLIGRVALHAGVLSFKHPVTGEALTFSTPVPRKFNDLF